MVRTMRFSAKRNYLSENMTVVCYRRKPVEIDFRINTRSIFCPSNVLGRNRILSGRELRIKVGFAFSNCIPLEIIQRESSRPHLSGCPTHVYTLFHQLLKLVGPADRKRISNSTLLTGAIESLVPSSR